MTDRKCKELNVEKKRKLKVEMYNLESSLSKILIKFMLKQNLKRSKEWSNETILKSLKYKSACKKGGYSLWKLWTSTALNKSTESFARNKL